MIGHFRRPSFAGRPITKLRKSRNTANKIRPRSRDSPWAKRLRLILRTRLCPEKAPTQRRRGRGARMKWTRRSRDWAKATRARAVGFAEASAEFAPLREALKRTMEKKQKGRGRSVPRPVAHDMAAVSWRGEKDSCAVARGGHTRCASLRRRLHPALFSFAFRYFSLPPRPIRGRKNSHRERRPSLFS